MAAGTSGDWDAFTADFLPGAPLYAAARPVKAQDDWPVAVKENTGVLGFEWAQAAMRRSVRIVRWRPGKMFRIEPGLLQPMFEPGQALGRKMDMRLLVGNRQHGAQHDVIAAGCQAHDLQGAGKIFGKRA